MVYRGASKRSAGAAFAGLMASILSSAGHTTTFSRHLRSGSAGLYPLLNEHRGRGARTLERGWPEVRYVDGPGAGWRAWREEVAFAEQFVAGSPDLAVRSPMQDGTTVALREVILHMVEEYARHLGHADLLRERIDGRVGQ